MPCIQCSNGKWKIGNGPCVYKTQKECENALAAIHAEEEKKKKKLIKTRKNGSFYIKKCKECE